MFAKHCERESSRGKRLLCRKIVLTSLPFFRSDAVSDFSLATFIDFDYCFRFYLESAVLLMIYKVRFVISTEVIHLSSHAM